MIKGIINTSSCTSHASTAIISSTTAMPDQPLPSSSSSLFSSSSSAVGGRAIDRHNPIITATDERRRGGGGGPFSRSAPTTPYGSGCGAYNNKSAISPRPRPRLPNSPLIAFVAGGGGGGRKKKKDKKNRNKSSGGQLSSNLNDFDDDDERMPRKSFSKASDVISTTKKSVDQYVWPPPPESSRYLLENNEDDNGDTSNFLDVLSSDFDKVVKLVSDSNEAFDDDEAVVKLSEHVSEAPPKQSSSRSSLSGSPDQVVVLRVSLHCRGCERKMKKHLSRMAGVKSFNVDFAAKKVTVVGDVTPLQVLASISKVKNAQMWKPPTSSSYPNYN